METIGRLIIFAFFALVIIGINAKNGSLRNFFKNLFHLLTLLTVLLWKVVRFLWQWFKFLTPYVLLSRPLARLLAEAQYVSGINILSRVIIRCRLKIPTMVVISLWYILFYPIYFIPSVGSFPILKRIFTDGKTGVRTQAVEKARTWAKQWIEKNPIPDGNEATKKWEERHKKASYEWVKKQDVHITEFVEWYWRNTDRFKIEIGKEIDQWIDREPPERRMLAYWVYFFIGGPPGLLMFLYFRIGNYGKQYRYSCEIEQKRKELENMEQLYKQSLYRVNRYGSIAMFTLLDSIQIVLEKLRALLENVKMKKFDEGLSMARDELICLNAKLDKMEKGESDEATEGSCWQVLGVTKEMTNEEIKQVFKKLCPIYHPDTSIVKSDKKIKEIINAYEQIKKERGI